MALERRPPLQFLSAWALLLSWALETRAEEGPTPEGQPDVAAALFAEFGSEVSAAEYKTCIASGELHSFVLRSKAAIQQMLEKRKSKMRKGLAKLGRAAALLADAAVEGKCSEDTAVLDKARLAAGGLKRLAGQLAEYCEAKENIEYKALSKLTVAGYDIHGPLNEFLGAWKKESADGKAVGQKLGKLFSALEAG